MVNGELTSYVNKARGANMTDRKIQRKLLAVGWSRDEVSEALGYRKRKIPSKNTLIAPQEHKFDLLRVVVWSIIALFTVPAAIAIADFLDLGLTIGLSGGFVYFMLAMLLVGGLSFIWINLKGNKNPREKPKKIEKSFSTSTASPNIKARGILRRSYHFKLLKRLPRTIRGAVVGAIFAIIFLFIFILPIVIGGNPENIPFFILVSGGVFLLFTLFGLFTGNIKEIQNEFLRNLSLIILVSTVLLGIILLVGVFIYRSNFI